MLLLLATLTVFRIIGLVISPLNLHGDEAQYWSWSRSLDWGYFSKPPMIAWLIATTTAMFGNAEWAVRLSTPLIHPLTAYVIFRTGRFLYNARTGFWAAILYFLMPAVWLSSGIVSTDVALLLFWALALNAWTHLRESKDLIWAILLGLAIGLGMLSKYAMLFFLPALIVCIFIDVKTRKALLSSRGLAVIIVAAGLMLPNLAWNAANDFATVGHTAANANINGIPFHPLELLEFWAVQFGVFGPVTMALLIAALLAAKSGKLEKKSLLLSLFIISPLLVISLEALLSRANANWAVTAYVGASLLVAHYGLSAKERLTKRALVVNIMLGIFITLAGLIPALPDALGQANAFKRMRGWPETAQTIAQIIEKKEKYYYSAIAVDNRLVFYDLQYYNLNKDKWPRHIANKDRTDLLYFDALDDLDFMLSPSSQSQLPMITPELIEKLESRPKNRPKRSKTIPKPRFINTPLRMWLHTAHIDNHAEATAALEATNNPYAGPVLVINYYDDYEDELQEDFEKLERLPDIKIDLGGGKFRVLHVWEGYGYTPTTKTDR